MNKLIAILAQPVRIAVTVEDNYTYATATRGGVTLASGHGEDAAEALRCLRKIWLKTSADIVNALKAGIVALTGTRKPRTLGWEKLTSEMAKVLTERSNFWQAWWSMKQTGILLIVEPSTERSEHGRVRMGKYSLVQEG